MGQQFSTSNNSVYVGVDKPVYHPGEVVTGKVLLNVCTPFQANKLVLKLEGCEKTRWEETVSTTTHSNGRSETHSHTETRWGHREFFKVKIALQQFANQMVAPGQYEYAWSTVLPANLPGSFDLCGSGALRTDGVKAKISYKAKVECEVQGMLKPNLRHKQRLWVQQRLQRAPNELITQDTQQVNLCCCFNKGSASVTAQVEKDSYHPGELVNVILQVDNQSSITFESVKLKLEHDIHLRDGGAHTYHRQRKMASTSTSGISAYQVQAGGDARRLSLQLPPDLQPTALGDLVKCTYVLDIRCKAPSCISDLKISLPVTIYQAAPATPMYTQPPPGWNPQYVATGIAVQLPAAPPMAPPQQCMSADPKSDCKIADSNVMMGLPAPGYPPGSVPAIPAAYPVSGAPQPHYPSVAVGSVGAAPGYYASGPPSSDVTVPMAKASESSAPIK